MNWARTRSFFPVTKEIAYLNHAGVAPISTRANEALRRYAREATDRGALDYGEFYHAEINDLKVQFARMQQLVESSLQEGGNR